ncbi:helix-turn-helix transcriptional regulator [Streptomyces roseoverticillatus]|uniref:helix-turn-helix domain-containing protein n=1 Tax=Streptomyces roseoverticillatus TaxID=66429 RepID=UPI001F46C9A2|nr:helix-turn-helix transcriptional regulator [Streptomyces roseoverticillatus]MCF3101409.1 helix-turn-helix transcriptional regulator [Streptomyces roseoverticillatus]
MSTASHIGQRISELRHVRQLTTRQLAAKVNISVSFLEKIERGARNPSPGLIPRLAEALGVGPDQITGQPYMNGTETEEQAQAVIPELRRILLTYDNPDDLPAAPRPLAALAAEMDHVVQMRQDGRYVPMGPLLPGLLSELTHIALTSRGQEQQRAFWWLARGYRATNSLAHKMGYHDLSFTAIERVRWAAGQSGDPLMQVTAAYLKAGAMVRVGTFSSARRVLEGLLDEVERLSPEQCMTDAHLALQGAVLLKLAILEARDRRSDSDSRARARLDEARQHAEVLGSDTTHYEMSFGPTNLRIHEVAALIDSGDTEQALARLREWGTEEDRDEWEVPASFAGERASHHYIDVAAARLAEGDRTGAHRDLLQARRIAPTHTRYHPTTRATAATLARLDRKNNDSIAGLARWAGA